ncbi:MAG: [protein-PII] uridylyltransferase, partial [Alphaproteobacteria bacterium]
IRQNLAAADEDTTICTSLLEMRPIGGDNIATDKMMAAFSKWLKRQSVAPFLSAKLEERDARITRTGGTRYAVEPNVKDGKGGLRDLHTLFWMAKYAYRVNSAAEFLETGILRQSEARSFAAAQRFLWTVRCFLHLHHGREDDRLSFDAQMEIAPKMRFSDRGGLRGVERFMKRYYLAARHVGNLTRIFCAALETDFDRRPRLSLKKFWLADAASDLDIAPFILEKGRLHLPENRRFRDDLDQIIRLFNFALIHELDIHPDTLRRLTRAVRAARTAQLQTAQTHEIFLQIISGKGNPERVLRLMNESGWLGIYMPDFGRIVGMMQFDMYHSYTVDEHSLRAVGIMREIEQGKLADVAPLASQLIHEISSRRALFVAIFLHDIAKGRDGDHSVLGAEVARNIAPMLGLNDEETETVVWLILTHLLMSKTAFRYDLNDPQTIIDFAEKVQSPERLKLLLVLTVADIQAVGPDIWNGWKASLMRDLYHRSEAVLGGAAPSEVSKGAAIDAMQEARARLTQWDDQRFEAHARLFYPSYWTNFATDSHLYHAELATKFDSSDQQLLVDFKVDEDKKSTILVVMAADHPGLFSRIVGSVAMSGCSIVNARINTRHDGTILDQFRIQSHNRGAVTDSATQQRIASLIEQSLAGDISLFDKLREKSAQLSPRLKVMTVPPRVLVTNGRSKTHTVIEVNGADRPGLLYQITYHLLQLGLQVNSATVSTYGEKAVDVFYVKDVYGLQIEKPATQEKIKQDLLSIFEEDTAMMAGIEK